MNKLNMYLQTKIEKLEGKWISKNSGYEKQACVDLGFECETKRYWDCKYNGLYIEIKKGKSIWLNEVRYCEILMRDSIDNEECKKETITMFIIPSKDKTKVDTIYLIDTLKLIKYMNLTPEWATILLDHHKLITRSLNCQQSMTIKDLRKIADYKITNGI